MFDITAMGEILIDFVPFGNDGFYRNAGGAPANLLAVMAKYGAKTAFIGKVGNDIFGSFLIETLKELKIDTNGVAVDSIHNTTLAFVSLDKDGERSFSFYRNFGADAFLEKTDVDTTIIQNSRIFHFGSLSLTNNLSRSATDYALCAARENGCIISFDPNYRELLWEDEDEASIIINKYIGYADIIKMSKEEALFLTGESDIDKAADAVIAGAAKLLLITDGANGIRYMTKRIMGYIPAIKVKAKDTTGAGDIFFGTFLYEFIKSKTNISDLKKTDIEDYIKTAAVASGLSTLKNGAIPSIPDYLEVMAYKNESANF